jgi:hypothetical protein
MFSTTYKRFATLTVTNRDNGGKVLLEQRDNAQSPEAPPSTLHTARMGSALVRR